MTEAEKERAAAMTVRYEHQAFVRVIERSGQAVWSKVDDNGDDLTAENSEGSLYYVRSVFVPHGKPNPLESREAKDTNHG